MTNNDLISTLATRVESSDFKDFSIADCVIALNEAKDVVIESVHPSYLDGLETIEMISLRGTGDYLLSESFTRGYRNDTFRVRYVKESNQVRVKNSDFIKMIPLDSMEGLNNSYFAEDEDNPVAYIFNNTLSIRPVLEDLVGSWTHLELFGYDVSEITAEMDGEDLSSSSTVTIGLSGLINGIVLDLAESNLWKADNRLDRSALAYSRGMDSIQRFNGAV